MVLKYHATITGDVAGVNGLWAVIEGLPDHRVADTDSGYRMWGDRMMVEDASQTDGVVKLGGVIYNKDGRGTEVWTEISRQHTELTFRISYEISERHSDVLEYRDGHAKPVKQYAGYFSTCDTTAMPVHHWTVWGNLDPQLLAPYLIPGSEYEHLSGEYPVRDVDGVRATIAAHLGGDSTQEWGTTAWTLNEDTYVQSVETITEPDSDYRRELKPHVHDLRSIVQRDITLTQDETGTLASAAVSSVDEFVEWECDLIVLTRNTGSMLHPTPNMIWHLLARDATSEERRYQLGAALRSPRWAGTNGRWPMWELSARHREETRGRLPEPLPPPDMYAFADELRQLEDR